MIKVPRKKAKRPLETTISLINIVFLMLIFFLVAGQLTPPQDPAVTLSEADTDDRLPPPDALYIRADGKLYYREAPIEAETYLAEHQQGEAHQGQLVKLAADEALKADRLLQQVNELYKAGAESVVIVTRLPSD
ncbi:MAG: biopolymer transporter ExbD [Roseibium sp.]|uniref:ExbD/TolR family protein n=1 Tax=Roseibium sp. TaxID=1936156 RepID=UPI00260D961C|nr:biopolymer transporter ExbD [Roseibium sp.]MCV0429594.1 biopolymer transporter ExbD [Roseibium sp.]